MKGLLVVGGIVENVALFDEVPSGWIKSPEGVGIGWSYDGSEFSAPDVVIPEPPELTAKEKRDISLLSMVHDFGDGRVMQVRPIDQGNLVGEIARMTRNNDEPQSWRMADNTWRDVTVEDLQEALASGQDQGRVIWDQYRDDTQ